MQRDLFAGDDTRELLSGDEDFSGAPVRRPGQTRFLGTDNGNSVTVGASATVVLTFRPSERLSLQRLFIKPGAAGIFITSMKIRSRECILGGGGVSCDQFANDQTNPKFNVGDVVDKTDTITITVLNTVATATTIAANWIGLSDATA